MGYETWINIFIVVQNPIGIGKSLFKIDNNHTRGLVCFLRK